MFILQLALFLTSHHHAQWVDALFTGRYDHIYAWALQHGFVYQR